MMNPVTLERAFCDQKKIIHFKKLKILSTMLFELQALWQAYNPDGYSESPGKLSESGWAEGKWLPRTIAHIFNFEITLDNLKQPI